MDTIISFIFCRMYESVVAKAGFGSSLYLKMVSQVSSWSIITPNEYSKGANTLSLSKGVADYKTGPVVF